MRARPFRSSPPASLSQARAAAPQARRHAVAALTGALAAAALLAFSLTHVQAGERTGGAGAAQVASSTSERTLERVSYGCGWAEKRLADPDWRPFLSRVATACRAIAANPDPRQISQQAYRERAFTAALDRAARGLDALYLEMWRVQLADESRALSSVVALNDTGVFLALQHERVFRLADRIVLHYDAGSRTAWLR
jgi:hypothetical protein